MEKYTLPYFGDIDLSEVKDYIQTAVVADESSFCLEIVFEGEKPTEQRLNRLKQFLEQLPVYLVNASAYINQEFSKDPSFVADYISFFTETIEENDDVEHYIDLSSSDVTPEQQLLGKFYLLRIGIYPNGGTFAVLDYTLDEEYTDDLLVVYMNDNGVPNDITIES